MQRRAIRLTGIVQGVGFRPFVYALATELKLNGSVQNCAGEVRIEVQGDAALLEVFTQRIRRDAPALARIDQLSWATIPVHHDRRFEIVKSQWGLASDVFISPDVSTCNACRRELFDPSDRRYRYPFSNCTNCGPRLTIIRGAPYDRQNTTMSTFRMCGRCRLEYEDPTDRRFHAQPIACPECGPRLQLLDTHGNALAGGDVVAVFCELMRDGKIGAVKGLGGYHLVCSATADDSVHRLRKRKHRDEKPFAVMLASVQVAARWCELHDTERELLTSCARPIVLLKKRVDAPPMSPSVAPGNPLLGVMLPYTPLHELLMAEWGEQPLVVTSGNRSDEPIAHVDADALRRLGTIADVFMVHNRPIHVRCDDSVTRIVAGVDSPLRRSRGYAPLPIQLPCACPQSCLAVGGQLKNVFALTKGMNAFLSHHVGDLDELAALQAFQTDIELYEQLFEVQPRWIIHDLHPDYASTSYALNRARQNSLQTMAVQHHHAHVASCMAEHGLDGHVIGVVFDGSGYGTDGAIWGGEFLLGGYETCVRSAHLRYVRLPGGERAIKQPWRMALSYLQAAGCDVDQWLARWREPPAGELMDGPAVNLAQLPVDGVRHMIRGGFNSPWTSSAGRLFDAVASLVGIRQTVSFEGQAAMQLEALADSVTDTKTYAIAHHLDHMPRQTGAGQVGPAVVDTWPLIHSVFRDYQNQVDVAVIARRFHNTLAAIIEERCCQLAATSGLTRVVLSGGVFVNALLSTLVTQKLSHRGLVVFQHHAVPANDGGLSLGQLAVAACRLRAAAANLDEA